MLPCRGFIWKAIERPYVPLKNGTRDLESGPSYKWLAYFYGTFTGDFERFQHVNFETSFLKN